MCIYETKLLIYITYDKYPNISNKQQFASNLNNTFKKYYNLPLLIFVVNITASWFLFYALMTRKKLLCSIIEPKT